MMDELYILQVSLEMGFGGGSECVAYELHRAWLSLGLDSRAITSLATEPDARQGVTLAAPWLAFCDLRSRWRYLAALIAVPLFTLAATWSVLRKRGSRIVVSHGDSLIGDVCVVHAVNKASLAAKWSAGYYRWLLNPTNLWVSWRDRRMLGGGRYRRVVAISERVRQQLKDYYHVPDERIVTIPNGINLRRFTPDNAAARAEVRREFGLAEATPLVLFVGNQYRLKGLEFAIRSLAEMNTRAILLVVGGDTPASFKRLADELDLTERVIFAGARSDLPRIYPAADALVLPTLYETFALVCLEAMASGLPVLACPVGGIEDYLVHGVNGLHIKRDPADIAAKLDLLLGDSNLGARIKERGLSTAENYAWEKIASQYLNLFDEIIAERAPHSHGIISPGSSLGV
jgi:glycosyltransferase involved in cell wall biosynthesis